MNSTSLDSNVVLRLVLNDIPKQSACAAKFVSEASCYVTDVVVAECVFVLEKVYMLERDRVASLMAILFRLKSVSFNENVIKKTFELYQRWRMLSFVDCYSVVEALSYDNDLVTFDRALIRKSGIAWEPK